MNPFKFIKRGIAFYQKTKPRPLNINHIEFQPNTLLKGKTVVITGGTSGIGYAIAKLFLQSGAHVIITGRNSSKLNQSVRKLVDETDGTCEGIEMDNCDIKGMEHKINDLIKSISPRKINILVNNAGIGKGASFPMTSEEDWNKTLETNLKGTYFLSQIIAKYFIRNNIEGNILNISSSSGIRPANSPYMASKWGIRGLTLGMAKALAPHGIIVNGIAPGPTATPMLARGLENPELKTSPIGRFIRPEEIAGMALVLVSELGRSIVGDTVFMTGGVGLTTFDDISYDFNI